MSFKQTLPQFSETSVFCQEVIITNKETRGKGVEGDPIRRIVQVYTKDGELIAERDTWLTPQGIDHSINGILAMGVQGKTEL